MFHNNKRGMTLTEVVVASLVVAIVTVPIVKFLTQSVKGLLALDRRQKAAGAVLQPIVEIERDLKDMNEIIYCSGSEIRGYMDIYRNPAYNPNGDADSDGQINSVDVDDDGDALTSTTTMNGYLSSAPVDLWAGWRSGLDVNDDDDDNDGNRDVLCRIRYNFAQKKIYRRFTLNNVNKPEQVIAVNVSTFTWIPSGGGAMEPDPNTHLSPPVADANGNGILDASELGGIPLNTFTKTRYIKQISYSITMKPDPKRPEKNTISSTVRLPLAAVKEKYQ